MIEALLLLGGAAQAGEVDVATDETAIGIDGSIEASIANTTGNTETLNAGLAGKLNYERLRYTHNLNAAANYVETGAAGGGDRDTTAQNFFVSYQLDIDISDESFAYGRVRYEQDKFSGYDQRVFAGLGYGHHIFETDELNWRVTAGPGLRWVETAQPNSPDAEPGSSMTELSGYAASEFEWDVRENVGVEHDFTVTYTAANTTLETEAGLKTKLTELLSARLSYYVRHETTPALDREPTDTRLRAGIVVDF
ncbi:DUF481 domain-containing protein [Parvularcula oceani]|uniref:DUF481 domain-containing protein n=1 Tax=Parvularcula oceani TaxID=1247963 RepID=UPI0004E1B208|nr:DUF481 domain-containing protein [Parvularcula oceani]